MKNLVFISGRVLLTLSMSSCAAVMGWHLWSFHIGTPWTRDAHVRADIVRLAPDISGPVTEVLVSDNAQVEKDAPLFRIEKDRFELALRDAEAQVTGAKAGTDAAKVDFERYQLLASKEAASVRERQHAETQMYQAEAAYQSSLVARDLAKLNLERTTVRAPASGAITNFSLRKGNYVLAGNAVGVLVEKESVYVAGYFEETKLPRIHIGDRVKIDIMGEPESAIGHVAGVAAGIEDRERSDTAGSLASVAPTFSWVRLAQRIPVRIEIDHVPNNVRLIAGRTATIAIEQSK
ncbi:HlyD family secretion protein [Agrobacterium fabrum]|uniref:efflux RND transporter periplasmic adaptor subunit n=1 Tax=Agrobacterium fabrum TaxID=1176649 RepID=UPI001572B244|nr:HlyD family secretion protein [Agrobacterium fabrum]WCK79803.1 HlyD family secretion protein [Agrobacterium fabrum]